MSNSYFRYSFILLFFLLLQSSSIQAAHVAGAQLNYTSLGSNQYEVTLRLYSHCNGGITHNNWAYIDVTPNTPFCGGAAAFRDTVFQISVEEVNNGCPSTTCSNTSYGLVRRVQVYKKIITVPSTSNCGWTFSTNWSYCRGTQNTQGCARSLGSATILDPIVTPLNSSPVLSSSPAFVFYNNQLQRLSSSMVDPDGDSLVYRVAAPQPHANNTGSGNSYRSGFSNTNPFLTTNNSFSFNSQTGEASFISPNLQEVSLDVAVDEYRNGQLIGTCRYSTYLFMVNNTNQVPAITQTAQWLNGTWVPQGTSTTFSSNTGSPVIIQIEMTDPDLTDSIRIDSTFSTLLQAYPNATIQTSYTSNNQITAEINLGLITQAHTFNVAFTDDKCPNAGLRILPISIARIDRSTLSGQLYVDTSGNCSWDIGEPILSNQLLRLSNGTQDWVTRTNSYGFYSFQVDSGDYTLTPFYSYLITDSCYLDSLVIPSGVASIQKDIPLDISIPCAYLEVSIGATLLRLCRNNTYYVNYCNRGLYTIDSAYVEVTLDPLFTITNSSIPISQQNGSTYTFYLGTLPPNACNTFSIDAVLDAACDFNNRGLTHCAIAEIFPQPDSSCTLWTGPALEVEGRCQNDSVSFRVVNTGQQALTTAQNYDILQDAMPLFNTTITNLAPGAATPWRYYPATGATYRAAIDHPSNYPWGLTASSTIEGCWNTTSSNPISTGMVNIFSMDEGAPYIGMDCQVNVIACDPNDKQAFPIGYDSLHYIHANEDIKYRIRFQNTGTYYAEDVVIVDTLSPFLDPNYLVPTVSSHSYTWELTYGNILTITFDNIMLPDSGRDLTGSQGFIDFKIKQQPDNPLGTLITNDVGIYFDQNPPVFTNTTFHTIGENFIQFINLPRVEKGQDLTVTAFPNPFNQATTLRVEDSKTYQKLTVQVYNALGQPVAQASSTNNNQEIILQRQHLSTGIYFYQLEGDGKLLHAGQLIVQ
ncbi:MAG: DUF7619 domain-containing protein [Aureispira sp.]